MPPTSFIAKFLCLGAIAAPFSFGAQAPGAAKFNHDVKPVLSEFCGDCHFDGAKKGNVAFDEFKSDDELLAKKDLWFNAIKNVRAGLMPPEKKAKPSQEQINALVSWVKGSVFQIDPANPDPGRVTIRRLNRNEYRNTIRDLMGYDYKVEEELPPDDTGYGFDNIGDVLTLSPLLMEKYMQAAEVVTSAAVPRTTSNPREKVLVEVKPRSFGGQRMSFYEPHKVSRDFTVDKAGTYKIYLDLEVFGQFETDPGKTHAVFKVGGQEVWSDDFKWQPHKIYNIEIDQKWDAGEKPFVLELTPKVPVDEKKNSLEMRMSGLRVVGPMEKEHWTHPKNWDRFFTKEVPADKKGRRDYAREVLKRFADKAYRRPVDNRTVDRLVNLAEATYTQPGKRFEDGIAEAMKPVLASPRFLFRIEDVEAGGDPKKFPLVDEYSLASRLSYFLWSTMPDEELSRLASKHELRKNLNAQVQRLLADNRADAFIQNFVGQWLQVRDVEGIDINAGVVLRNDASGPDKELEKLRARMDRLRDIPDDKKTEEEKKEAVETMAKLRQRFNRNRPAVELDGQLRKALKEEVDLTFGYIARNDRSVTELVKADYTFLNDRLAKHYVLTNAPGWLDTVKQHSGGEMRLVKLEPDSPRGGVITDGATLIVTSNPTRTSPVKRGLFILDNLLGTPSPPPPPDIPPLENAKDSFKGDRKPTNRELLEIHRQAPLCHACHNRMDPLGLALENFNALGMWRDKELGQPIDARGKLITGEEFNDIREVKETLVTKYRGNFYRCMTEKLLTYALGRGLDYYDVDAVDRIVEQLDRENGRFSVLLSGVIESAPFQKRRNNSVGDEGTPARKVDQRASLK